MVFDVAKTGQVIRFLICPKRQSEFNVSYQMPILEVTRKQVTQMWTSNVNENINQRCASNALGKMS